MKRFQVVTSALALVSSMCFFYFPPPPSFPEPNKSALVKTIKRGASARHTKTLIATDELNIEKGKKKRFQKSQLRGGVTIGTRNIFQTP